jgi:probable rRNA maturation factor
MLRCYVRVYDAKECAPLLRRAARTAAKCERSRVPTSIDVALVSDCEIRELNRTHRGIDKVTDVLSFPMSDDPAPNGRRFLGDVLICESAAQKQAEEYGHSFERELAFLTVHGVLHLLGYDHGTESERAVMREREEYIMERLGLFRQKAPS